VLSVNATVGSYVSSLGAYDTYTQGADPLVVMGSPQNYLAVRCYVDEILVARLPASTQIQAQMSIRGSDLKVPLEFVRVQPYVSPKIELSNERQEQVDLRVLPVIFRFQKGGAPVYPGQEVDVYIGQGSAPIKPNPGPILSDSQVSNLSPASPALRPVVGDTPSQVGQPIPEGQR